MSLWSYEILWNNWHEGKDYDRCWEVRIRGDRSVGKGMKEVDVHKQKEELWGREGLDNL